MQNTKRTNYTALTFVLCLFSIAASFQACKNDFDVNGPWKETMVVYGLLDPSDAVQYVKISKAFLGKGNAYDMAMVADSSNYAPGVIEASIVQYNPSNQLVKTIPLTLDSSITKSSGTFASTPNYVYSTTEPLTQDGSYYALKIKNVNTGLEVSSSTPIVGKISLISPFSSQSIDYITNYNASKGVPAKVKWATAPGGKMYQLTIRFNYKEVLRNTTDTLAKSLDWVFPVSISSSTDGSEEMVQELYGEAFFTFLAAKIPIDHNLRRFPGKLEYIVTMGAAELYNYTEINKPSTGIVQEKPLYTNIQGGIGIFSSRSTQKSNLFKLNDKSLSELLNGPHTIDLDFCIVGPGSPCN
jgi:hypothetical protein